MITYPLIPPGLPTTSDAKLTDNNIVGESVSPFTGSQQVLEYAGEWFEAELSLPPMARASAAPWVAWMSALRGKSGSFILGDPLAAVPRGILSGYSDLLRFTEKFDNAVWQKAGIGGVSAPTVTANVVNDPNSNLTADALNFAANGSGQTGEVFQVPGINPVIAGRTFTFSVYLRVASGTATINIIVSNNVSEGSNQNVTVTTAWQRFSITCSFSSLASATAGTALVAVISYAGAPAQTVYAWGAQLDRGSAALPYSGISNDKGPSVLGANQTGKSLTCFAGPGSVTGVLKAGDYIQTGSSTTQRLYEILSDANTDVNGTSTFDIFPRLRESPADAQPIYYFDARGTFRLAENLRTRQLSNDLLYQGISLKCKEAI